MKKILALILVVAMAVGMLTALGTSAYAEYETPPELADGLYNGVWPLEAGSYYPALDNAAIPNGVHVYGWYIFDMTTFTGENFDLPTSVAGYTRVNSLGDMTPGTWVGMDVEGYNYVFVMEGSGGTTAPDPDPDPDPDPTPDPGPIEIPGRVGTEDVTISFRDIKIEIDGAAVTPVDVNGDFVEPFIIDGTTYLPLRAIAGAVGYGVGWDNDTSTVTLTSGSAPVSGGARPAGSNADVDVIITFRDIKVVIDGTRIVPVNAQGGAVDPFILDGTTYLPLRAVAGAIGYGVDWDGATSTVILTSDDYVAPPDGPDGPDEPDGPPAAGAGVIIEPDASDVKITATGLVADGYGIFDLGIIFGTPGSGPYSYALFFEDGGTVTFDKAVTLSYQGSTTRDIAAGQTVTVDASIAEYSLTLDDGNSVILIPMSAPGNFATIPADQAYSTFPGTVSGI